MNVEERNTVNIPIEELIIPKDNRKEGYLNILQLAESINRIGLIHPIIVKIAGSEIADLVGKYEVIAGARRTLAFQHLGLSFNDPQFMKTTEINLQEYFLTTTLLIRLKSSEVI